MCWMSENHNELQAADKPCSSTHKTRRQAEMFMFS